MSGGTTRRWMLAVVGGAWLASAAAAWDGPAKKESIYDRKADARVQVEQAKARAKAADKRILLMFGGDWCGWCHKLHGLFQEDEGIRPVLFNEYELVLIDTEAPNADGLLKEASKGQDGVGFPFLAVLDAGGKLLIGQKTDPLEEGDHHDPKKVRAFLDEWKVAPKDAEDVVKDALARASADDRRVLLTFGAPWCGWCRRLEALLARPEVAEALAEDFVVAKVDIDRMTHGRDVMTRYRKDDSGGIPWYVVLDGEGRPHGTADGPSGNIGYPFTSEEIEAFMKLLASQEKLKPAQLEAIRKAAVASADRINAEREPRGPAE